MERPRAHRRQIRQIDPQQLSGDEVGRVVGQIMHPRDHRVRGHHQPLPGAALDQCGVVAQSQPARPGERREIAPDALELALVSPSAMGANPKHGEKPIVPSPPHRGGEGGARAKGVGG